MDPGLLRSRDTSRSRWRLAFLIVATIALGLASRVWRKHLPPMVGDYAGDTLYALMLFWMAGFLFPSLSTRRVIARAFMVCVLIEVSQLYQADWINAIRHTRVGGLVLGFGFLWSDLICYAAGVALGGTLEWLTGRDEHCSRRKRSAVVDL